MAITLDHINIRTDTPESVKDTFERLLGLEAGYRPPFPSKGIWLYGSGYPLSMSRNAIMTLAKISGLDGSLMATTMTV